MRIASGLSRTLSSRNASGPHRQSVTPDAEDTHPRSQTLARTLSARITRSLSLRQSASPHLDAPTTSLSPIQVSALTFILSLPPTTASLTTIIARLGHPLSRAVNSEWPRDLCGVHTWLEAKHLRELRRLIGREIGMLDGLYTFPSEFLEDETREMLHKVLLPYRYVFPGSEVGFAEAAKGSECIACTLGFLFQDVDAVKALAMCAKGRKKTGRPWPEVLAWLECLEIDKSNDWSRRWLHDGKSVRNDRRKVRAWREGGGGSGLVGGLHEEGDELDAVVGKNTDNIDTANCEEAETNGLNRWIGEKGEILAAEEKVEEVSDAEWLREQIDRQKRFNMEIPGGNEKEVDSTGRHAHLDEALEQNNAGWIAAEKARFETVKARAETYLKLIGRIPRSKTQLSFQCWLETTTFASSSELRR